MEFIDILTEQTTAMTDAVVAIMAISACSLLPERLLHFTIASQHLSVNLL